VQYEGLDHELAMAYGDEFRLEQIRPYDWAEFAAHTNIPRRLLAREMIRMGKAASEAAQRQAEESVYVGQEKVFVAQIAGFVRRQATSMADMAPATVSVELE
jgi:serine/threonine-protein kinase HipA